MRSAFYIAAPTLLSLTIWLVGFSALAQKPPYCYYKARSALWENDISTAMQWADSCLELKPQRYEYAQLKGEVFLRLGQTDQAIKYFLKADGFRKGCSSYWLAKAYCVKGDTLSCIQWAKINLESVYREPESKYLIEDDFAPAANHKLWAELWQKDWYSALEKDMQYANYLIGAKQFDEAIELLSKRIKGTKSRITLYELRGLAHMGAKNYQLALNDFEIAHRKSRGHHRYCELRARCLYKLGQNSKALKLIEQALQKSGGNPQYLLTKAQVLAQMERWEIAYSTIKNYLDFFSRNPEADLMLIQFAYEAGYYTEALLAIAKQLKLTPGQPDILLSRGKVYLKTSHALQAIQDFDSVIVMDYNVAEAYYLKGLALLQLFEKDEACRYFSISASKNFFKAQEVLNTTCRR